MEEVRRWSVTYTNHVKQKRKVYHDGYLVLQSSGNKVMLYDESDKLLETRFVKKDDLMISGETVTFNSHLVDLGELCQGYQPQLTSSNSLEKGNKVSDTSSSTYSYSCQNRRPMVGKSKRRSINLSPSRRMIRDFKTSEMNKFGSSPNCMDMTKLSTKEWQVLYTTQKTQKAKKFHDGFLQLIARGSQGRQVKLYDTNRIHLDGRFLKKDEVVCSGEPLILDGHLVEIGEPVKDDKPPTELNIQGKSCEVVGQINMAENKAKTPTNKKFSAGKPPDYTSRGTVNKLSDSSYKTENAKFSQRDAEPRRSVCDILSILRQPNERKVVPVNKPLAEENADSHSSVFQSDNKKHIKEYTEECCGTATEELREKRPEQDSMIRVIKTEAVEVIIDAEECAVSVKPRSSSFHRRSQRANFDVQCINPNKLMSNSSSMESHAAATAALNLDGQKELVSESPIRLYKNEGLENPPITYSCEEVVTETNAALANGLSTSRLPKIHEDKINSSICDEDFTSHNLSDLNERTLEQDLNTKDTDDFPSFDLGI